MCVWVWMWVWVCGMVCVFVCSQVEYMYNIEERSLNGPKLDGVALNIPGVGNFTGPGMWESPVAVFTLQRCDDYR